MAKNITLEQIIKDASRGILHPISVLRKTTLDTSKMNAFVASEDIVKALEAAIDAETGGITGSQRESIAKNLESRISGETGDLLASGKTYDQLYKFTQAISTDNKKYELGHVTGAFSIYMMILQQMYNPDTSGVSDKKKIVIARQRQLIDNALRASLAIDKLDHNTLQTLRTKHGLGTGASGKDLDIILKQLSGKVDISFVAKKDVVMSLRNSTARIDITAQLAIDNKTTGNLISTLGKQMRASFKQDTTPALFPIDTKLMQSFDPTMVKGSPSYLEDLDSVIYNGLMGKKPKTRKRTSKARINRRIAKNTNTAAERTRKNIAKRVKGLQTKLIAAKQKKKFIVPTVTLKAIINESLAEHIKASMADAGDPLSTNYLRNISGRFADSAHLLTLNRTQAGALIGTYDFMQNPYGTFLPGGKLSSTGRNPMLYIEGSIRNIAVQVLKKSFKGIALELK